MIKLQPVTLEGYGVRLEPLAPEHHDGMVAAAADGRLWAAVIHFGAANQIGDAGLHFPALIGTGGRPHATVGGTGTDERRHHWEPRAITTS